MKRLEILAPAGGEASVIPAVRSGADAIYLGATDFSARSSAHNFDREQLRRTVQYCHLNGVAVHLACNTLIRDEERDGVRDLIKYACELGIDAVIVQDTGIISLIRKWAPELPVHGSTQLSVHTRKGVEALYKAGLTRVVLSRELSKTEIEEIAKDCPVELEVFVHGALCMSVSGQCYFSAMLGSRSGNRGSCAQPCRLPFSVRGGSGHDLSLRDISLIPELRELQEMGIASAKIEGRMKRPEYVAAAVAACRQSLDEGFVSEELYNKLTAVFSRSGFTDGYYKGRLGPKMFGVRSKENVDAADKSVFGFIHGLYKKERSHIPVDFSLEIRENKSSSLTASDDSGNRAECVGDIPERAVNRSLDKELCEKSIGKTGGTPYFMRSLRCGLDPGLTLPAAQLKRMRAECLDEISAKRERLRPVPFSDCKIQETGTRGRKLPDRYRIRAVDTDIPEDGADCELLYVPCSAADDEIRRLLDKGFSVAAEIPRGLFGIENRIFHRLREIKQLGINEVLAGNIGAVEMARELGMEIHGGFGLNITNTEALLFYASMGVKDCEVSFELTLEQISALGGVMPVGVISAGRLPLMLTRNCPAQNDGKGCKHCRRAPVLTDRKGIEFPMQCMGSCTEILNSVPLTLADRKRELQGIDFEVIRFSTENLREKRDMLECFKSGRLPEGQYTRGLYYRGVE